MLADDSSFYKHKVYADICGGSIGEGASCTISFMPIRPNFEQEHTF